MRAYRADNPDALRRDRLRRLARDRALARLADVHRAEYDAFVVEERDALGIAGPRQSRSA
jgi:hypothetical protein